MILSVYKKVGETPLETINRVKGELNLRGEKFTYAGRLDPLAEGVLILLSGKDIKNKDKFLNLHKVYCVEIIFGFKTDTYDILGIPVLINDNFKFEWEVFESLLSNLKGEITLPYPPFSSKPVLGQPLFVWARKKLTPLIGIPDKKTEIRSAEIQNVMNITGEDLLQEIERKIDLVKGDFRQEKIKDKWRSILSAKDSADFYKVAIRFEVTSGTYIRSIANLMGEKLKSGACVISLKRESVGEYSLAESKKLKAES